jgi:ABC-type uncharacterized transport system substrate-binding protein
VKRSAIGAGAVVSLLMSLAPVAALAQPAPALARIGVLLAESAGPHPPLEAFRAALRDLGHEDSRATRLELRWAEDKPERFEELARDLVRIPVDVIVAGCTAAAVAARRASPTIPIVMAAGLYPVERGLIASFAQPGGTVTGVAPSARESIEERIDLLRQVLPRLSNVAILWTRDPAAEATLRDHEAAAILAGIQLRPVEIGGAGDLATAIEAAARGGARALTTADAPLFAAERGTIAELALRNRLPSISGVRGFAQAGGFIEYGPSVGESWQRAAGFVDRLLRGAKPGDLPVEEPARLELIINVRVAQALGVALPPSLLLRDPRLLQ